jgi:hypothetical protein
MFMRFWRFITLMLTALNMAMAFSHLLQMGPRLSYDGPMWRSTQNMYINYGPPIGSTIEMGAFGSTLLLSILVFRRGATARWTWLGMICFAIAQVLYWFLVQPVNNQMITWPLDSVPPGWESLRSQWEYTHAVRAILMILGFASLVRSVLVETPISITEREEVEQIELRHVTAR